MRLPPRRLLTSDKRTLPSGVAEKPTETTVTNPPPSMKSILKKTLIVAPPPTSATAEQAGSNQLLAGYLAHEYLNKGTLFGEKWNPARSESIAEGRKNKQSHGKEPSDNKRRRYVEVADILRAEGSFMPGIVNPSQLARSLKLWWRKYKWRNQIGLVHRKIKKVIRHSSSLPSSKLTRKYYGVLLLLLFGIRCNVLL